MGSDPFFGDVRGLGPKKGQTPSNHYSYATYADPAMADSFDAKRFGGPIGGLLLADQQRVLAEFLGDVSGRRVLDVGTGTGRAAIALANRGARVTGIDASTEMLRVARERAAAGRPIDFAVGDAHALEFPDRAFDAVVCLRVLMHVPDWPTVIAEICRVAARTVVFDYPALTSVAALQALWRHAAVRAGRKVEAYRVFRRTAIANELARHGFRIRAEHKQFVLPIAFHKLIASPRVTRVVEDALARAGVLRLAGSPVTIAAERCAS